jgi:hypothetical protein
MEKKRPKDRDHLPYGMWICADGTVYLFNRKYKPIWKRLPKMLDAEPVLDQKEWVKYVTEIHFWNDGSDIGNHPRVAEQMRFVLKSFLGGYWKKKPELIDVSGIEAF